MGTVVDRIEVTTGRWRNRHSALHLAVDAAKTCLHGAGRDPHAVDLLINAGIYRDRNLAEPALAALIQQDVGANPEAPHRNGHGTFSFDVANGACGVLTALQIVDGFLRSHTIGCALVVASDANPGRGLSEHFPFSPVGAALSCEWVDGDCGLGRVHWFNVPDDGETFRATVGFEDSRNLLRFHWSDAMDEQFARAGAEVARRCLRASSLQVADVDVIVAAPARRGYHTALAEHLGVPVARIVVADDEGMHTAALAAALRDVTQRTPDGGRVLLIAAGAGVTAGAALYTMPPAGS
ncbi:3-oxoacyl-[acyl-carrier-protein] synthase III C-terminal domain-containing protein [Mycolicibacterium lacusdiani]|uniref:3-oxoacyl-[acyl-carrier-protein] synthase III C-terminal domain-containing protein n=1 Tax=Mycolicibacterium lacusdiani TaxID=2895283 RepID=UPI001F250201|nr:3-oxoacyl-[acyl-carrier-protein] synthase III C-terminal domain-containing protein [Mycolicibacterium lacusdiani]